MEVRCDGTEETLVYKYTGVQVYRLVFRCTVYRLVFRCAGIQVYKYTAGIQVRCDGTEERLVDCRHSKQEDCGPGEVTLVVCSGPGR